MCQANFVISASSPLEKWLQCHDELIQYLRTVRDKLLHPLNESNYADSLSGIGMAARHVAPDLFLALEQLQNQLDDFLDPLQGILTAIARK